MREKLSGRRQRRTREARDYGGALRGEDHPAATITERELLELRYLLVDKRGLNIQPTQAEIAAIYDFSPGHIGGIATGAKWSHLGAVANRRTRGVRRNRERAKKVTDLFGAKVARKVRKAERVLEAEAAPAPKRRSPKRRRQAKG